MGGADDSPVLRQRVFKLTDGTLVLQRDDTLVQEILTGKYRAFRHTRDFGNSITNAELAWLSQSGYVRAYDDEYISLESVRVADAGQHKRIFYLSTTLPEALLNYVRQVLQSRGLDERFQ